MYHQGINVYYQYHDIFYIIHFRSPVGAPAGSCGPLKNTYMYKMINIFIVVVYQEVEGRLDPIRFGFQPC